MVLIIVSIKILYGDTDDVLKVYEVRCKHDFYKNNLVAHRDFSIWTPLKILRYDLGEGNNTIVSYLYPYSYDLFSFPLFLWKKN